MLYSGELSLSVSSPKAGNVLKGQLTSRPVAGAVDSKLPALLKRVHNNKKNSDLTGMAWLSIDFDCDLYYEASSNEAIICTLSMRLTLLGN